jgi:hypothetical protein
MRGAHELDGAVVVEPGQRHVEADRDRERAVVGGAEADRGVDRDGVGVDLLRRAIVLRALSKQAA